MRVTGVPRPLFYIRHLRQRLVRTSPSPLLPHRCNVWMSLGFGKKKIRLRYWYRHFWPIPVTYTEFRSLTSSSQSFAYWYVYQMIRWKLKKCDMKLHLILQKIFQLIVNCIRKKLGSKWSVNASSLFNKLTRRRYRDRLWEQNHSSKASSLFLILENN